MTVVLIGAAIVLGLRAASWVSRRTDALRKIDPGAAQRIDEARLFKGL